MLLIYGNHNKIQLIQEKGPKNTNLLVESNANKCLQINIAQGNNTFISLRGN